MAKRDERDEHVLWPKPLGLIRATETALFIAAPLLSAGALSLIGVVCADAEKIRLAGPTLLLLVMAVIALMLSIQLGYHARQWIYSYEEIQNWTGRHEPHPADLELQKEDCRKGEDALPRAVGNRTAAGGRAARRRPASARIRISASFSAVLSARRLKDSQRLRCTRTNISARPAVTSQRSQ